MATQSWSTRIRHDSDANFREWGSEFATYLALIGLVQTADTGQINWTTVTRASTNSNAGYEIWRFNDALQSTAPIFIRFDYGTGANAGSPRIQATVGTSSNGSGTIGGTALTTARTMGIGSSTSYNSDTGVSSYFCLVDGQLTLAFKATGASTGASTGMGAVLLIKRTIDSAGAPDATAAQVYWGGQSQNAPGASQALRFATPAAAYTAQTTVNTCAFGFFAQAQASTTVGADIQAALGFTWTPRMQPLLSPCGVLGSEVSEGSTFTATMVGTTPRTYLRLPGVAGPFGCLSIGTGGPYFAVLWE